MTRSTFQEMPFERSFTSPNERMVISNIKTYENKNHSGTDNHIVKFRILQFCICCFISCLTLIQMLKDTSIKNSYNRSSHCGTMESNVSLKC